MEEIKIKLADGAMMPIKATNGSSGYDLFTLEDQVVEHGMNILKTGVYLEMPCGYEAQVRPRSGISVKGLPGYSDLCDGEEQRFFGWVVLGTIDADYRGEIGIIVRNGDAEFTMKKGTKLAQLVFAKVPDTSLVVTEVLSSTERNANGFGSSGERK